MDPITIIAATIVTIVVIFMLRFSIKRNITPPTLPLNNTIVITQPKVQAMAPSIASPVTPLVPSVPPIQPKVQATAPSIASPAAIPVVTTPPVASVAAFDPATGAPLGFTRLPLDLSGKPIAPNEFASYSDKILYSANGSLDKVNAMYEQCRTDAACGWALYTPDAKSVKFYPKFDSNSGYYLLNSGVSADYKPSAVITTQK